MASGNSRVAGVFDLGDGEHFVVAEWFPDPMQIEADLLKIASDFDDWTIPLEEAKQLMIEATQAHFDDEQDPYGDPWVALSENYKKHKLAQGFPDEILVGETGDLKRAATSEKAWFVDQDSIFFNPAALPPYGPIHQEGTQEGEKAGKLAHALDVAARSIGTGKTELTAEHLRTIQKGSQGLNLPQRMFIGADLPTIDGIEAIFIKHIETRIEEPWRDMGGPIHIPTAFVKGVGFPIVGFTSRGQPMVRTPGGIRFASPGR